MIKKAVYLILIIVLCFSLTGCWSKQEPKDMAVVLSVVYDKDENDLSIMNVELLDATSQGSGETAKVGTKLIKLYGKTFSEGIRDTRITLDKMIYGAHNKARIFTERFARDDVKEIMDFYLRDHLTDEKPYLFVLKNEDPMLLYKADYGLSTNLGSYIDQIGKTRKRKSEYSVFVETLEFLKDYYSEGKQPVTGVITVVQDESSLKPEESGEQRAPKYLLEFNGLAVFKDNKMVGYLDKYETRGYQFVRGEIKRVYISIPVGDKYVTVNCHKTKSDVKTSFSQGMVNIEVKIDKEVMISKNGTQLDLTKESQVKIVEEACNKLVTEEIQRSVAKVQQDYKSDIFGFGEYFHKQNPEIWKTIKANWDDDYFSTATLNVTVNTKVQLSGEIKEKFGTEVKESL